MRSQWTARILIWSRLLSDRHCRYCQQLFQLSRYHPYQLVCSRPDCQRRRQWEFHRRKLHTDAEYHQVCRDSQQKWQAGAGRAQPCESNPVQPVPKTQSFSLRQIARRLGLCPANLSSGQW